MTSSDSNSSSLRLATRGSPLALWQARHVSKHLNSLGYATELQIIKTASDLHPNLDLKDFPDHYTKTAHASNLDKERETKSRAAIGGAKGAFVAAISQAVADGKAHLGVHSLKDLPLNPIAKNLEIAGIFKRNLASDVLLIKKTSAQNILTTHSLTKCRNRDLSIHDLRHILKLTKTATTNNTSSPSLNIATSSLRRTALMQAVSQALTCSSIRGNVDTRLRKILDSRTHNALLLSTASIVRLGFHSSRFRKLLRNFHIYTLDRDWFIPSAAQGIIALEAHKDFQDLAIIRSQISCKHTYLAMMCERYIVGVMGGHCMLPFGCYASISHPPHSLHLRVAISATDGKTARTKICKPIPISLMASPFLTNTAEEKTFFLELQSEVLDDLKNQDAESIYASLQLTSPWKNTSNI